MKTKICPVIPVILALVAAAALAGCASPATRIKANQQLFASIAPASQELIKQGQIALGFTPDMVMLALGRPDVITRRTDASGTSEIWRWQSVDKGASTFITAGWGWGWGGVSTARGGWGWGGAWGTPIWGWNTIVTATDYLRVSFRDGRVVEINRLR